MKRLFLILFLITINNSSVLAADLPDTPGNRQAAAEQYLDVVPMGPMIDDMIVKTSVNVPSEHRKQYIDLMNKSTRVDVLERATVSSMARHFTVRELKALANFYGSPEGRSTTKKFGAYMADVMPVIQQEMERVVRESAQ